MWESILIYTNHFKAHYECWLCFLRSCLVGFCFENPHVHVLLVGNSSPTIFVFKIEVFLCAKIVRVWEMGSTIQQLLYQRSTAGLSTGTLRRALL